ncbi:hypothetical protein ACJRO7_006997 [Eucalyptus globulus]|uniref:GBF-interacting protein 1 N-terminal domain-containing protein n=1 Tax=Eucalyptus globulus TaxID=34317 RepID=A0ABD3INA4_EUCGL
MIGLFSAEEEKLKGKNREVPVESKEQVERTKEILFNCTEREIYEAHEDCKIDSNDAVTDSFLKVLSTLLRSLPVLGVVFRVVATPSSERCPLF